MSSRGGRLSSRTVRSGRLLFVALLLGVVTAVLLNANGREVGSFDTQPTKFAARELAETGTLSLDRVVRMVPGYAERPAFARALGGHYRSAYPVLPSVLAAGPAWVLSATGLVDLEAPMAPALVAKITASLLVTLAVVFAFLIAAQRTSPWGAAAVAAGFGLGTNLWLAGQTLGGHETVAFALTAALLFLGRPGDAPTGWRAWVAAAMLAMAGAARPQAAPAVAVLALSLVLRNLRPRQVLPVSVIALGAGAVVWLNVAWFGNPLGAAPMLEALHGTVHATEGTFTAPWNGALGLLFSPSRGLLIFSPVVLVCVAGLRQAVREGWRGPLLWCLAAFVAEFAIYASYTVWWGGHAYGPRYCLDALPPLVPMAAAGVQAISRSRFWKVIASCALAWSVVIAATGAFCYPADKWNTDPRDVDRFHERLWDWNDPQFARCWKAGPSPQNFGLFQAARPVQPPAPAAH